MEKGLYRFLPVLLTALFIRCATAPAVYADTPAVATGAQAERKGTPSQAWQEDEECWEEEGTQLLLPVTATPSMPDRMEALSVTGYEGCSTAEELREQLEAGEGEIRLAADIRLKPDQRLTLRVREEVSVDMNGYGIIVPRGARLVVEGPALFEGDGSPRGMFQVSGELRLRSGATVRAKGPGAVGISITDPKKYSAALQPDDALVEVSGSGSVGIDWQCDEECKIEYVRIEASGQDSVGVRAAKDVNLRMCSIAADGQSVSAGGEIRADLAELTPTPENARVISREPMGDARLEENGISVRSGTEVRQLLGKLGKKQDYWFYDTEGAEKSISYTFPVIWESIPEDISRPGVYRVTYRAAQSPGWMAAQLPAVSVPVYVVEEGQPHISAIFPMEETVNFRYFEQIEGMEAITLLCSEDEGETWRDVTAMPGVQASVSGRSANLSGLEKNKWYQFKVSVIGGPMEGESMAVSFSYFEHDADRADSGDRDGDRDGDDREDLGELPPVEDGPLIDGSGEGPGYGGAQNSLGGGTQLPDSNGAQPDRDGDAGGEDLAGEESPGEEAPGADAAGEQSPSTNAPGEESPVTPAPEDASVTPPSQHGFTPAAGGAGTTPEAANIVLSGRMLEDQLAANPKFVTLLGDGIRAVISSESLKKLEIPADGQFSARLVRLSGNSFEVCFWAGETQIRELGRSDFAVDMEWEPEGGEVVCRGEDGSAIPAVYRDGRVEVRLRSTGRYVIEAVSPKQTGKISCEELKTVIATAGVVMFALALY